LFIERMLKGRQDESEDNKPKPVEYRGAA